MSDTTERKTAPAAKSAQADAQVAQGKPLVTHLLELRKALIISACAVLVLFLVTFELWIDPLMQWITRPILERGIDVIYTNVSGAFVTKFKVALIAGIVLASPVILWEIWTFIRPALYTREKKTFKGLFFIALFLFLAGVAFAYFAIYNLALNFLLGAGMTADGVTLATPTLKIDDYVSYLFGFLIPFGIAFELPVFVYMTTRMGWTNYRSLASKRKYVLLGIFVIAAILTPPDIISQVALGMPMYLLYEVGVQVTRHVKPKRDPLEEDDTGDEA